MGVGAAVGGIVGGVAGGIGNLLGGKSSKTPSVSKSARETGEIMAGTWPYAEEYQPKYAKLAVDVVREQSPRIMDVLRGYNPAQMALLDELTGQAGRQLRYDGGLDPVTRRAVGQNWRGAQAARGLGWGPGDAAMEAFYQTQTREQRRGQNQALASGVIGLNQNLFSNPFAVMLGYGGGSTMPDISSVFGTAYNARAAADTANVNRYNAAWSGLMQTLPGMGRGVGGLF